ncbi:protein MpREF6 [Marchantia polymorpha subsp. ruderalis]
MGEMDIAPWLKTLPLAPEFRPTEAEFLDPMAYILKIEEEARMYGVCKIIPPYNKASKKTVAFHLNRSLAMSRDTLPSSKMHGPCPSMSRSMGGLMAGPQLVKQKSSSLDVSATDSSGKAKFDTRRQQVGWNPKKTRGVAHSQTHKLVWESGEKYTLEQFEQKAKQFSRQRLGTCKDVSPLSVETLFWKAAADKHSFPVEYANDIPGSAFAEPLDSSLSLRGKKRKRGLDEPDQGFGMGFRGEESLPIEESPGADEELDGFDSIRLAAGSAEGAGDSGGSAGGKLANSAWNMRNVARSHGSLLRYMPDEVPGVTSPMVYIGMLFSWFAWHVEDHELHSLNYLHTGASKTWYAVPGDAAPALEEAVRVHGYGGQLNARAAFSLLGEKTTVMSPEVLVAAGVPCCRLVQNAGEYVVTFPRAYHLGFSHGFNCGEAANFATPGWLDVAKDAAARRAAMNYLPMLSHQQLLYLLTMSLPPRMPASSPSEPRSSRLKVRKKSPGEEMVKNMFVNDVIHNNRLLGVLLDKGVPCCLLAKDAVSHAAAKMPSLEDAEQRLRPADNSLPASGCLEQVGDCTNLEVAVCSVVQTEDVACPNQISSVKLADSSFGMSPSENLLIAEAETNDAFLKVADPCASSEFPGSTTSGLETKASPYCRNSAVVPSPLAIDWGILPCAACGILCYATMAVVEPTLTALTTFKALPVKPVRPAVGLSNGKSEAGCDRPESLGLAVDTRASMDLNNGVLVSQEQAERADVRSEPVDTTGVYGQMTGIGTPPAEAEHAVALKYEILPTQSSVCNFEASLSDDVLSAKNKTPGNTSSLHASELEDAQPLEGRPALESETGKLENNGNGRAGSETSPIEVPEAQNAKENVSRGAGSEVHSLETATQPEVKGSNLLSSLQLLVSTYDEDASDVEGEDFVEEKLEDWEADKGIQVLVRPDSVVGHLINDVIGLSADVSWQTFNPTTAEMKVISHISTSSPSVFQSVLEGAKNLDSVFTSGGFAFVEEDRLVDLPTLERILNEKDSGECGKKAISDGCSPCSDSFEDPSDALDDEKVDDMQEFYRRINSQALTVESQDDELALINLDCPTEFSWQPEPSCSNDVISGAVKCEAETSNSRIKPKNLGACHLEPVGREEIGPIKDAASLTSRSMLSPGMNCSRNKISYSACHPTFEGVLYGRLEEKAFEDKMDCRIHDVSKHLIGDQVSYYSGLPPSFDFVASISRDTEEFNPRTCSSQGRESCPTDQNVGKAGSEGLGPEKVSQAPIAAVKQRARGGVGRPRVLCLEHAVEAQKRLQDIGGANILIVCHSGFEDYELRAKDIAQELGIEHTWRDITFSKGSTEEIELVKMAVDVEENDDHGYTDWISQLGMLVHPRFTTKESEAFDSFKKVTGALRAGPFKKAKPGRPTGSNLMAGRLGISRKRVDDLKSYPSSRASVDFEGQLKGSKKKKCMVAGKWCGKVWRVNQVHPLLGGCRSIDSSANLGSTSMSVNISSLSAEITKLGLTRGLPTIHGPLGSMTTGVEDLQNAAAKKRGRQRKMLEHTKDQVSEDSSLGPMRNHMVSKTYERKISEQGKDQVSEDSSGGAVRTIDLVPRNEWKMLEQAKDQGSEDSSLGPLKVQLVGTSNKACSAADSEGGQYASMLQQNLQFKGSYDQEENADNNKDDCCSPSNGAEPAGYPGHSNAHGVVPSLSAMTEPTPLAAYDLQTTDDKNKGSSCVLNPPTTQRSAGVDDSSLTEHSEGVIPLDGDSCALPAATAQTVAPSQSGWQVLSELEQDAVGKHNGDPPDSPQVHSRGSLTEPQISAPDAFGQQPIVTQSRLPIARASSEPGSLFCSAQHPTKDGGSRAQRIGKGAAVWCDVPIASSIPWTAGNVTDQAAHPPSSVHPSHNGNAMYFGACSDQAEDTGYDVSNNVVRPIKGKLSNSFVKTHGLEDSISIEKHQSALKMRKMLEFERPQSKRSPADVTSSEEPVNDVESITTSKMLGWKRKTDGVTANASGKKAKSYDSGKNVKFQEEPVMLAPNNDKTVALIDEVNNVQELCESSCHPENELEQFDYEDDGSQHTLRDIKYVYGVSDSRSEFLAQAEGFAGEDTSDNHLPGEQIVEDQDSCVPVTMLDSHDYGRQKLQKSRMPYSSRSPPPDDSGQCASGLHPLDLLPLITSSRGKPLGKTRGKRSKPLKQIWTSLKHPQLEADKNEGKRDMNSSEAHNIQAVQCVEARFEAEDCDRGPEIVEHPLGRTSGQSTRLRARVLPVDELDSGDDGDEPKVTAEKGKKKGRPKKKKVVGRKPKGEEDKEFQCDLDGCRMSFATEAELGIHKKNRCTRCNKRFFMHKYLLQHRRVHQPDRPLKCPWPGCQNAFKWAWARTEHIRVHTGERPYTCPICEQTFRFVSDFSRHKRNTGHTKRKAQE